MDIENCEFKESVEILWNITGKKVKGFNINPEAIKLKKSIYGLYKDASSYYKSALDKHPDIKQYLLNRWILEETIKKFHFGYSDSGISLYNYLKEKWYDDKVIDSSNIFLDIRTKKDKFINRIIFPIQNLRGDFVAFAGRIIDQVSGTALTEKQLQILKRLTKKLYLCFDADKAWENATRLSLEMMKNKWFEVKVVILKWGKDPDEIIKSGKDFAVMIKNALSPIGYYIEKSNFDTDSIDEKKKLLSEALWILKSYSDVIEKDTYLKEISKKLNIDIKIIYDAFNKIHLKRERKELKVDKTNSYSPEDMAIAYIIHDKSLASKLYEKLVFKEEISLHLQKAVDEPDTFLWSLELEKKEFFRGLSLKIEDQEQRENSEVREKTLEKLIDKINKDTYKRLTEKLKKLMQEWDMSAFEKYSATVKKAKENRIK